MMKFELILLSISLLFTSAYGYVDLHPKEYTKIREILDVDVGTLLDPKNKTGLLEPILKVRIPGTPASEEVQKHFIDYFDSLKGNWTLETDRFQDDTPTIKNVTFTNLVFTRDPPHTTPGSVGRLALVAHYDSKIEPEGFIGAIDSAFPCAMMMYMAHALDDALTEYWASKEADIKSGKISPDDLSGVQIIFLDGEEAYVHWTNTDSIYGARHLANVWEKPEFGINSNRKSILEALDLFVLLDLLGSSYPTIHSYFPETDWLHKKLGNIEKNVRAAKFTKTGGDDTKSQFFPTYQGMRYSGMIEDDHIPFANKGVPILHLIPVPFPHVWHTLEDDGDHLDIPTMYDLSLIMTCFVAEYMNLSGSLGIDITHSEL